MNNTNELECDCVFPVVIPVRPLVKNKGVKKTLFYIKYHDIKARCHHENARSFKYYGARGIRMCEQWVNSYEDFKLFCEERYSEGLSIDRTDNDKGYCPHNCRFTTRSVQQSNRRTSGKFAKGVRFKDGTFISGITIERKHYHLGSFKTEKEASEKYNEVHCEWYGK